MDKWEGYYGTFFTGIEKDPRIRMAHLAVFSGLFYLWAKGGQQVILRVFAKEVMAIAKISCKITYLRIISDLSSYGYICYEPSRSKHYPSEIRLLTVEKAGSEKEGA